MLCGSALHLFLAYVNGYCATIHEMENRIRARFITDENILALTGGWENTSLLDYKTKTPEKAFSSVLNLMVSARA